MLRDEQSSDNSEREKCDGVFFFQAHARDDAEPEPITRVAALNSENCEVGAAHPQVRLKTVCCEQAAVGEVLRRDQDGHRA